MRSKFKWIFTLLVALTMQFSFAQEKTVTGVVSDDLGPIAGANVVVKGTTRGTTTDFDGNYAISAKQGDVLVVSYVGYANQEVTVGSASTYNVTVKAAQLEEVIVTAALGVKKSEKAITYAAQSVKGEDLTEARESNIVNSLSGKIAGVQVTNASGNVGSSSRIVLRGVSSITGNNQPLFVVDGVPFDNTSYGNSSATGGQDLPNGAASINPNDIESVTVLKGPTAAALYGLRASNGVILITTKSGKKGKFEVNFNTNVTFSNPLVLPSYQNSYGQGQSTDFFKFDTGDSTGNGYNDVEDVSWGPALDKGLSFVQWDSFKYGGAATPWVSHPDNVKDFFQTGISQTNSLTILSGGENSSVRLSIGNSDEKGMVPFTELKRFNAGVNATMKIGEKLSGGINATYYNTSSGNLPTQGYDSMNPVSQLVWSARSVNFPDLKDWRSFPISTLGAPLNWNQQYNNNPYWLLENNFKTLDQDRVVGAMFLNYKFTPSLSINGKVSIDQYSQRETLRNSKNTIGQADGFYQEVGRRYSEINAETILTWNKSLSEDFKLTLNGGMNSLKRVRNTLAGTLNALELPNLYTLTNGASGSTPILTSNHFEQRINSVLGFGELSYKNFAFLNFTGRNDWTSLLAKGNNSFFYPSVSGSFIASDAFGFQNSKVNYLKLRGGWSQVGSTGALTEYNLNQTFALINNNFGTMSSVPNTQWNPYLKPEKTTGIEVGLDLNAFQNKVRFAATYYSQKSESLILPLGVDGSTFFVSSWENGAEMTNKGIELQLGATLVKNDNFSFDVDLNFAKNNNKVESLGGLDAYRIGASGFDPTIQAIPGESYGSIYGHGYARDDSGNVIYSNGLPVIDSNLKILGNITPDWTGGANFTLKYKNFDFNTLIDAKMGGDVVSMTYIWGRYAGVLEETLAGREGGIVGNGVMSDGNGGYVQNNVVVSSMDFNQSAYNASTVTEGGVFDASYVKLRQVVLGYSLPKKWLNGTFIKDFKVSVVGRNLAILYKKAPHIDPETSFGAGNGSQGMEYGQSPSARNYGFNVNIKF